MSRSRVLSILLWVTPPLVAIVVFAIGINWGLPSRSADKYLFGDREPWTGKQILELTGGWGDPNRASDHDANPLQKRDEPIVVNATDKQRAEIVQRFRLYSNQPDEMITLRALAQMKPGQLQLDPKFYQYGGLWVYPVGALLKAGSMLGVLQLRADVAYYLDHPEEFGKFYVVMRAYSAAWGIAGVVATMLIVWRMTRDRLATIVAGLGFALLPVVVNMAHEAKPHLAGAVLLLWTILAAAKYVEHGGWKWAAIAGAVWGAAVGMVLLSLPGGIILLTMVLLSRRPLAIQLRHFVVAVSVGVAVYAITNPYVSLHLFRGDGPLGENVQNYGNFYQIENIWDGLKTGADLIGEGTVRGVAFIGLGFFIGGVVRFLSDGRTITPAVEIGALLAVVAVVVGVQFVLLGAGKPGEYGRFAILPDVALLISVVAGALSIFPNLKGRIWASAIVLILLAWGGGLYLANFATDHSRTRAAVQIEAMRPLSGSLRMAIVAEPAPYCLPPVDLYRWQLVLLPAGSSPKEVRVLVAAVDEIPSDATPPFYDGFSGFFATRISWANKPIKLINFESKVP